MLVTGTHLIFTTSQHLLKFVHLEPISGKSFKSALYLLTIIQTSKSLLMNPKKMNDVEALSEVLV
jgi:hypothetical protein